MNSVQIIILILVFILIVLLACNLLFNNTKQTVIGGNSDTSAIVYTNNQACIQIKATADQHASVIKNLGKLGMQPDQDFKLVNTFTKQTAPKFDITKQSWTISDLREIFSEYLDNIKFKKQHTNKLIWLAGPMGSGKTTIGKKLNKQINNPLICVFDSDQEYDQAMLQGVENVDAAVVKKIKQLLKKHQVVIVYGLIGNLWGLADVIFQPDTEILECYKRALQRDLKTLENNMVQYKKLINNKCLQQLNEFPYKYGIRTRHPSNTAVLQNIIDDYIYFKSIGANILPALQIIQHCKQLVNQWTA